MDWLSPAQLLGYLAFVLGVTAFLQKDDRRLKAWVGAESLTYVLHFALLGNPSAAASALVSAIRSFLAIRFRSAWLAAVIVLVSVALGLAFSRGGAGWLPVAGSCIGAVAVFTMRGVPMRLVLLTSTFLWLANNALSRSIGGTLLEASIATASLTTIARMAAERRRLAAAAATEGAPRAAET
ncbi:MAG TPA: YgjV family protein [Anaeromyxobacteraceae bacterium]|nr:YgjV family protein [Anaeromyxobacteraceae bacterium]